MDILKQFFGCLEKFPFAELFTIFMQFPFKNGKLGTILLIISSSFPSLENFENNFSDEFALGKISFLIFFFAIFWPKSIHFQKLAKDDRFGESHQGLSLCGLFGCLLLGCGRPLGMRHTANGVQLCASCAPKYAK
jgi:hypothetical protein